MKQPFRFHRGELDSGFFLSRLVTFLNFVISDIVDEIVYWAKVQFKLASEVVAGEIPMRDDDIQGILKVAGVFPLYFAQNVWTGMIAFSESKIVSGAQRSERGLFVQNTSLFNYVRTGSDTYPDDITVDSSPAQRTTLVPTGQPILGYVRADEHLYDDNGNVIWANVHATPPVGVAYDPFYGDNFLTISNDFASAQADQISVDKLLFEVMQEIRFNGVSTGLFLRLTETMCENLVQNISITFNGYRYVVTYTTDPTVTFDNILRRYTTWQYVVALKFKLYELSETV